MQMYNIYGLGILPVIVKSENSAYLVIFLMYSINQEIFLSFRGYCQVVDTLALKFVFSP